MEGGELKKELGQLRSRIQQNKDLLTTEAKLFKEKSLQIGKRKSKMRQFSAAVREWEKDKRLVGAVQAYFDIVPEGALKDVETVYPLTTSKLLAFAENVLNGVYGSRLQWAARSEAEEVFDWPFLVKGILAETMKTGEFPEIFDAVVEDPEFIECVSRIKDLNRIFESDACDQVIDRISVDPYIKKAFVRLFFRYLGNITHPSSVAVGMWADRDDSMQKSLDIAASIKNPSERLKSYVNIVDALLGNSRVEKAMQVVRTMKPVNDKGKILVSIVDRLLHLPEGKEKQIDDAIDLASLLEQEEKDNVFHKIAVGLARHQVVEKALGVAQRIQDPDMKNLTLSNIASALAHVDAYDRAGEIARLISDSDFRKDAYEFIVKSLLEHKSFKETLQFVDKITDQSEQIYAAKMILSSVRSKNESSKVDQVCNHFHLIR